MSWLTVREVLRLLDVSISTLHRLELKGQIIAFRDHRGVRHYRPEDVEHLRQQREPKATSPRESPEDQVLSAARAGSAVGARGSAGRREG